MKGAKTNGHANHHHRSHQHFILNSFNASEMDPQRMDFFSGGTCSRLAVTGLFKISQELRQGQILVQPKMFEKISYVSLSQSKSIHYPVYTADIKDELCPANSTKVLSQASPDSQKLAGLNEPQRHRPIS